ncbi:ATP-binding protein [Micromonospora sp. WMMC273]|uniref:ATP-binding protein n=1 Tax=Micromonospora sp. WMMC273 TaxID=3015157 RepID=UPI0022B6EDBB|nr:ATP-binding protein [Micromonospora sp. WMMC273]MCZ7472771.1 ATP-binding protein [Micromonospora sp. WMMC273]MCZ7478787.1 ATP-binding protein [Micromonospora sp. WMMC273]
MPREIRPLETLTSNDTQAWVKQRVINVIRSYHNAADVIAEPIQNAVDEVLSADGIGDVGRVRIILDTDENTISVRDNGRGISSENIEKWLAPDVGSKRADFLAGLVRGHKGVGLTFLAYGFNHFELESRTLEGEHYRLRLEHGRAWVESPEDGTPPVGQLDENIAAGRIDGTGTIVTVSLSPQTEPRSLRHAFPTVDYAVTAIRNQTAAGIVEPPNVIKKRELEVTLEYKAKSQTTTVVIPSEYRYPHDGLAAGMKVLNLGKWLTQNKNSEPGAKEKKAYHACYWVFTPDDLKELIGARTGEQLAEPEEVAAFLTDHQVHVYALFSYSASYRDQLGVAWKIPGNRKALHFPSLRVATDGMISSWTREITLTHRGFNVDRTWLLYSLRGIEPDLGRKDFPPNVHDFLKISEEVIANRVAEQARPFLRVSPPRTAPTQPGYEPPAVKAFKRREKPLSPGALPEFGEIALQTEPQSEQDVIALYNELVGMGILRHLQPVFFSGFDFYDSYFEYKSELSPTSVAERLPGTDELDPRHREGVAEFKLTADSILADIVAGVKQWTDMTFLVCWKIGTDKKSGGDEVTFAECDSPIDRRYHGVTHLARLQSAGEATVFVIALADFLRIMATEE